MNINTAFQGKVIKPWHDLNRWLAKPYALQPDLNDPLRMAASLAIEIRHLPEKTNVDEKKARESCFAHDVIRDVADAWKHGCLDQKNRNNHLSLVSDVEVTSGQFRFLRNRVRVEHATKGEHDLLDLCAQAIRFWATGLGIVVEPLAIQEGPNDFNPLVALYFDPRYQFVMESVRLQFFERRQDGLYPVDPVDCHLEILKAELLQQSESP
jgi:hypothetical protein